jgi:hypothetical protein
MLAAPGRFTTVLKYGKGRKGLSPSGFVVVAPSYTA